MVNTARNAVMRSPQSAWPTHTAAASGVPSGKVTSCGSPDPERRTRTVRLPSALRGGAHATTASPRGSKLRAIIAPPARVVGELARIGDALSTRNAGVTDDEMRAIDDIVADAFGLTEADRVRIARDAARWLPRNPMRQCWKEGQ